MLQAMVDIAIDQVNISKIRSFLRGLGVVVGVAVACFSVASCVKFFNLFLTPFLTTP